MIATDIATVMGTDVKSATLQLGKALEEPRIGLSMLRRSGISFTEEQKKINILTYLTQIKKQQPCQKY